MVDVGRAATAANLRVNPNPTQADVDRAYRGQMRLVHPDMLGGINEEAWRQGQELSRILAVARVYIYHQRWWQ